MLEGPDSIPGWDKFVKYAPPILSVVGLKYYFGGSKNTWDRDLHGKVFLVTGATSGLGRALVHDLASKGAQIIMLTATPTEKNPWLVEFIEDLRDQTNNFMIYSEVCDLSSLYSVRKFATKWLDNTPPRRLDGVICLAGESLPSGYQRQVSEDGVERQMAINFLGHAHLLTLLAPALKYQPADRDVKVLVTTCLSQSMASIDLKDPLWSTRKYPVRQPWKVFGTSKLMLSMYATELQKRLEETPRKDGLPYNVRVNMINPGFMRSPSTRRVLSFGSLFGLFIYLLLYPLWFIFLKSCEQGAQSFLHVIMNPVFLEIRGGNFINNCRIYTPLRKELANEELMKELYDTTQEEIARLEKLSAIERNKTKKLDKEDTDAVKDEPPLFPTSSQPSKAKSKPKKRSRRS